LFLSKQAVLVQTSVSLLLVSWYPSQVMGSSHSKMPNGQKPVIVTDVKI
jgi:hypothetical protein